MAKAGTFEIEITSAVLIDGAIVKPGQKVTIDGKVARNLLGRGKAQLARGQAMPAADGPIGTDGKGGAKRQGKKPADEGS